MSLLDEFAKEIKEKYPDAKIILFGSRARGDYLKKSDYDLIIVSDKFKNKSFLDRIEEIQRIWWNICEKRGEYYDLDVIPLTYEEFYKKKNQISIVAEAIKEGKEI